MGLGDVPVYSLQTTERCSNFPAAVFAICYEKGLKQGRNVQDSACVPSVQSLDNSDTVHEAAPGRGLGNPMSRRTAQVLFLLA